LPARYWGTDLKRGRPPSVRRDLKILNARGLHARASAKFVKCAEQFEAAIEVSRDGQTVPGTSIMGLMMLAAQRGSIIRIEARGRDAAAAVEALARLIAGRFGEDQDIT
jgi:phosphocarrier protein